MSSIEISTVGKGTTLEIARFFESDHFEARLLELYLEVHVSRLGCRVLGEFFL